MNITVNIDVADAGSVRAAFKMINLVAQAPHWKSAMQRTRAHVADFISDTEKRGGGGVYTTAYRDILRTIDEIMKNEEVT